MYTGITAHLEAKREGDTAAKSIGYISNFSIEETRDVVEVSRLGHFCKDKVAALYSWSASADGAAEFAAGGQDDLREALKTGKKISVSFYLDSNTYFTGDAIVESFSVDISAEDKANVSISLSGCGELLKSNEASHENASATMAQSVRI